MKRPFVPFQPRRAERNPDQVSIHVAGLRQPWRGLASPTRRLDSPFRELMHLQRQAGNRAVSGVVEQLTAVQLQPTGGGGGGAAAAPVCSPPSHCPAAFCAPFPSRQIAEQLRAVTRSGLLFGISQAVDARVVPLWEKYIDGGDSVQNLSGTFAADFTASQTTSDAVLGFSAALARSLRTNQPTFPAGSNTVTLNLADRIQPALDAISVAGGPSEMNFAAPEEVPGNLAGGIGDNQATCPVGARPSPLRDQRVATGTALVVRNSDGSLTVTVFASFRVTDTIDLCPGDCGAPREMLATVPLSRFEASGISGDVPFFVDFPGPPRAFTMRNLPPPPPPPPAPPTGPINGEVTASALRIRQRPSTSAPILGRYQRGSRITIVCAASGTDVEGNSTWDRTTDGFVSDRFVNRLDPGPPPPC